MEDQLLILVKALTPYISDVRIVRHEFVNSMYVLDPNTVLLNGNDTVYYILSKLARNMSLLLAAANTSEWSHKEIIDNLAQHRNETKDSDEELGNYLGDIVSHAQKVIPQHLIKDKHYTITVSVSATTAIAEHGLLVTDKKHQFTANFIKKEPLSYTDTVRKHINLISPVYNVIMKVADDYLSDKTSSSNEAMISLADMLGGLINDGKYALKICDIVSNLIDIKFHGSEKYSISKVDTFGNFQVRLSAIT